MSTTTPTAATAPTGIFFIPGILALLLGIATALVAVSGQSLWIDEANSALKAITPTWTIFSQTMQTELGSDLQMPLYMLMLWGWEKIFGHSEYALRALNIPLFVFALIVLGSARRLAISTRLFALLFACTSPFLWSYLDEARPYTLQFLAAVTAAVPLINLCLCSEPPPTGDLAIFTAGIVLLCASSLIGVIYSLLFGTAFLLLWIQRESWRSLLARKDLHIAATVGVVLLALLAGYYAWSLHVGAKASSVGRTNAFTIGFALYEFLGFSGFGPARSALRDSPVAAIVPLLPMLTAYLAAWVFFLLIARRGTRFFDISATGHDISFGIVVPLLIVAAASFVAIVLLGRVGEFRVVGRHFMPLYPFLLIGVSTLATGAWASGRWIPRSAVVLLLLASVASAATYRFAPRHAKDDYRSAAALAREDADKGQVIWWAADRAAANFYQVFPQLMNAEPGFETNERTQVFMANNRSAEYLKRLPAPTLVILSKPDINDGNGCLREFLVTRNYKVTEQLPAFKIYSLPRL